MMLSLPRNICYAWICCFSFRGLDEHAYLRQHQIEFSYFKRAHEIEGHMWVRSTHLNDKSNKLSFTKGRMRDTKRNLGLPVNPDNLCCPDGTIFRYVKALAPSADQFYAYPATLSEIKTYEGMQLGHKVCYSSDRPLGKGKLANAWRPLANGSTSIARATDFVASASRLLSTKWGVQQRRWRIHAASQCRDKNLTTGKITTRRWHSSMRLAWEVRSNKNGSARWWCCWWQRAAGEEAKDKRLCFWEWGMI